MRNFGQKHELQYLYKICCVKSGFQILYAVEQFSSLFSKDKLKQGAHIHQIYDSPFPRVSWQNCRAVPSQQLPHVLCGAGTLSTRIGRERSFIQKFSSDTRRGDSTTCGLGFCVFFRGKCRLHVLFGRGGFSPPS